MLVRLAVGLTALGGLIGAVACGDSTSPSQTCGASGAAANITATSSNSFSPAAATIAAGQSVCWQTSGSSDHTVTADTGNLFDDDLDSGTTFVHTFPTAGVFPYHCRIHSGMVGTITVQ